MKQEPQQMTNEERLMKLKQEFQMDEYQDDSQSSSQSNTPPRVLNNRETKILEEAQSFTIADDNKLSELVDEKFMESVSNNIKNVNDWKKLAQVLSMDEDTIAFIESDVSNVKEQSKKILQLWKVSLLEKNFYYQKKKKLQLRFFF